MEINEFESFLVNLTAFFERKHPTDKIIDLWFDMVHDIPVDELLQIYNKITKENESFPRNLTAVMWALHYDIIAGDPIREKVYKNCPECSDGLMHLRKMDGDGLYMQPYVFRCATCRQRAEAFPWGNRAALIREGYESPPIMEGTENIKNIKELRKFILDKFGVSERAEGEVMGNAKMPHM